MRTGLYNAITLLFTLLTIGMIVFVVIQLSGPSLVTEEVAELPTVVVLPTLTPSNTPTRTIPPTFTPTFTVTPSPTLTLTVTSSVTPTFTVSPSPTITDTPAASPTPTITETSNVTPTPGTPTATPPPPYIFSQRGETRFSSNFANTLGCAWQGIGGQVFDLQGIEMTTPYQIHVYGGGIDQVVNTGSNSIYGPSSGWEVQVSSATNTNTYFVELRTSFGTVVSAPVQVTFAQDCTRNVALVDFVQIQDIR